MNDAHWHLVVNHLPIIFPMAALIVLATGLVSKSEAVKRTAYLLFVIGALTSAAAMATGEGAEEVVENLNGVSENYIETHEEAAETFALMSYILGVLSIIGLWANFQKKSFSKWVSIAVALFALVVLFFAKATGTTGGEIRHSEIRANAPAVGIEKHQEHEHE
ncbi:DUF2231 domain-containing protein [Flavobacterium longum]|uniref:hypothetical protein n=1 Tax=Flavobacterium longum TaxID=1299340 RepID=UPI0039EB74FE